MYGKLLLTLFFVLEITFSLILEIVKFIDSRTHIKRPNRMALHNILGKMNQTFATTTTI